MMLEREISLYIRLALLGAFFFVEGPPSKNTFGSVICELTQHKGTSRSYNPGSFGMTTVGGLHLPKVLKNTTNMFSMYNTFIGTFGLGMNLYTI
jgi:hypothetical protein